MKKHEHPARAASMRCKLNPETKHIHLKPLETTTCHSPNQPGHDRVHRRNETIYLTQSSCNLNNFIKPDIRPPRQSNSITVNLSRRILIIFIINIILSHLSHLIQPQSINDKQLRTSLFNGPTLVHAETKIERCEEDSDCREDQQCYKEYKMCICPKTHPIEDEVEKICRKQVLLDEACFITKQCLAGGSCIEGICACDLRSVPVNNPSNHVTYCHPKGGIREQCNYDVQCPKNAYCSGKNGCLCHNGYGETNIKDDDGVEGVECLPKYCHNTRGCESEYHTCDKDKLCKCLPDHWDPTQAICHKFGPTSDGIPQTSANNTDSTNGGNGKGLNSILKDLMRNNDKLWLVIIILVILTLFLLALMILILRKYCLGYCWTAHKKHYEPNSEITPKSQFDKNSISNRSFRKKNAELDDEDGEDTNDKAADRRNLVTGKKKASLTPSVTGNGDNINGNHHVKVDMRAASDKTDAGDSQDWHNQLHYNQVSPSRPLPSSLSTPV